MASPTDAAAAFAAGTDCVGFFTLFKLAFSASMMSIQGIKDAARHGENLMPKIIAAVEAHATVGEIADAMRVIFGEYRETVVL